MKKALAAVGVSSTLVTVLINLIPDTGQKILFFILFGLFVFGISWSLKNINKLIEGLVLGFVIGAGLGICVATIEWSSTLMSEGIEYNLLISLKWILPILAYTYFGIVPWK
jgi:hypothetical protein